MRPATTKDGTASKVSLSSNTKKRTRNPDLTREKLLDAAVDVFVRDGYAGTSVHAIAKAADLTTGAIYKHFANKDELLIEAVWTIAETELGELLRSEGSQPSTGVILSMGDWLMAEGRSDRQSLLIDVISASKQHPELAALLRSRLEEKSNELEGALASMQQSGEVDSTLDRYAAAWLLQCIAFGAIVMNDLKVTQPKRRSWRDTIARLVESFSPRSK